MYRCLLGSALGLAVFGGLAGCTKPVVREKQIADPLLVSKKPVEGKPHLGTSPPLANDDIPPPPPPPPALPVQSSLAAGR